MSNFTFLQQDWRELYEAVREAEGGLRVRVVLGSGFQDAKLIVKAKDHPTGKIQAKAALHSIWLESVTHPLLH